MGIWRRNAPIKDDALNDVAHTLIHEATHRFAGTGDFAYKKDGQWDAVLPAIVNAMMLNNADSYAWLCVELPLPNG